MWREQGVTSSPLTSVPFFSSDVFQLDWLHVMDIGVTCDFLGNCFCMVLRRYPEPSQKERVQAMFRRIVAYYNLERNVPGRLETLTINMIQKTAGSPPKLRARGAEARGLVKFARQEAAEWLRDDVPDEAAAKAAAVLLEVSRLCERLHRPPFEEVSRQPYARAGQEMYGNLSAASFNHVALATSCRKFASLWAALESSGDGIAWRMKPKVHQMQELCEFCSHNPSANWTYRDEDFGGSMANLVRIRGGKATPKRVGSNALTKFCARHPVPSL
jgi:hypothetical protein